MSLSSFYGKVEDAFSTTSRMYREGIIQIIKK